MKKLFLVLAIATSLVACNNATETTGTNSIDSARIADSIKAATTPAIDTASKNMDSATMKMDSAAKKMDSVIKK